MFTPGQKIKIDECGNFEDGKEFVVKDGELYVGSTRNSNDCCTTPDHWQPVEEDMMDEVVNDVLLNGVVDHSGDHFVLNKKEPKPTYHPGQKVRMTEDCGDFKKGQELLLWGNNKLTTGVYASSEYSKEPICLHPDHWQPVEEKPQTLAELLVGKKIKWLGHTGNPLEITNGLIYLKGEGVGLGFEDAILLDSIHYYYDPPKCEHKCEVHK